MKTMQDSRQVRIGKSFCVDFQRTLRIPDDGNTYPLPPGLGMFPVLRVDDYAERVPPFWRKTGGVFIPMYQREALWLDFTGTDWPPVAVKVGVGKVNALTGAPLAEGLAGKPQDYLVCPDQPWLDGIKAGEGFIRQFVAMPLGMGYSVEGQITGQENVGGVQFIVYEPKPGRFQARRPIDRECCYMCCDSAGMGLGAGGRMRQKVYPDEYGIGTWDLSESGRLFVHIVNSMMFREITGQKPPPTPVTARTYAEHGLPWFDLYDEKMGDLPGSKKLAGVKSIREMDKAKGFGPQPGDSPLAIPASQVKILGDPFGSVRAGEWDF